MSPVRTSVKIAGAAGVAAIAAGIGASQALADTATPTPSGTTSSAPAQGDATGPAGKGGPGGPGGLGGPGRGHGPGGADAAALAKELGVTEAKVQSALDAVRDATKPDKPATPPAEGTKPTPPTEAERAAREKARTTALAKELGLSESKVQAAFDALHADREAARKGELSSRLDTAVADGKLTAADKASVLKAFEAGVLGGPRP